MAAFAQRVIDSLKRTGRYCYSLSPSDGGTGWSQSAQSKALEEKDPNGALSRTPLILSFYNAVARRVHREMPDRIVAGYIYASYLYPPKMDVGPLQSNLFLVIALSDDYGYRLFRPDVRKEFDVVMGGWARRTDQLGYYDLPVHLLRTPGIPLAPGIEILHFIYPRLKNYGVKHVFVYGHPGWGGAVIGNYLEAKLAWNPDADVRALASDFYRRAYGVEAGRMVGHIYDQLDSAVKSYYLDHEKASYTLTPEILKGIYAAWYPQAEKKFLQAKRAEKTPLQTKRLAMFEQSMILLRWHLRHLNMISPNPESPLYRTDAQLEQMLRNPANTLALSPILETSKQAPVEALAVKGTAKAPPNANAPMPFVLRNPSELLLYSPSDTSVTVSCPMIEPYAVEIMEYCLRDEHGNVVRHGMVHEGTFLKFPLKGGSHAFLTIRTSFGAYQLRVEGCDYAFGVPKGRPGVELLKSIPTLYFYVPPKAGQFVVTLIRDSLGLAVADLYSPDGTRMGTMGGNDRHIARVGIPAKQAMEGVWRIVFRPEESKTAHALWVKLDGSIPSWLGSDPQRLPKIAIATPSKPAGGH